ncbi:MAG: hypothetical protein BHV75_08450 [Bacteroides oleiciplenus]|nr:MAG: hypothetical protein BHV75_08450 [Bacteroides oleiciplenus]
MSIARLTISWKADAKVVDITIHSKYIYHFFIGFRKLILKTLIDKDVVEHNFKKERGRAQDTTHNYIMRACERQKNAKP